MGVRSVLIEDSYFDGSFTIAGTANDTGGLVGNLRGVPSTITLQFESSYSYIRNVSIGTPPVPIPASVRAFVGGHSTSSPTYVLNDNYFTAPAAVTEVLPVVSPTATNLSAGNAVLESSYVGFDFTTVWSIDEGVNPPRLD